MDSIDLVHERLRAYFKKQIDLQTVKRIVVQTFITRTTSPPVRSTREDVGTKFTELHTDIEPIISKKSLEKFKKYIKLTKSYEEERTETYQKKLNEGYQKKWTETHLEIMKELMESDKATLTVVDIDKVVGSVHWLVNFYTSLTRLKVKQFYFQPLVYFLQDLLITLLVLKCLRTMGTEGTYLHGSTDLPPKPAYNLTPYMVSPESDLFQMLILREMIIILGWNMPRSESLEDLAAIIVEYFKPQNYGWPKKGVNGVLTVVKDQSRYMTLRSPHLRKNFVAYKTKYQVETISIPRILARIPEASIDKEIKELYDLLKEDIDDPILKSREERVTNYTPRKRIINHVYHVILKEIIIFLNIKNIEFRGEMIDTTDFLGAILNIARHVLLGKNEEKIAATIEALANIIGLRAYLYSIEGKVAKNRTALIHQNVLFRLIAFRALLMCTLRITPRKELGVQQVARVLPKYAKDVRLYIQPPNKFDMHVYLTHNYYNCFFTKIIYFCTLL